MPHRTNGTPPATVYRRAVRVCKVAGVMTVLDLAAWVIPDGQLDNRLELATYLTLLLIAVGAGCVAMLASCQLAISKAFSAGFQTGQIVAQEPDPFARAAQAAERGEADPILRLVE